MTADEGAHDHESDSDPAHPLAPYLPRLTIDWVTSDRESRYREALGTLAFVDISGFTKLSEGLARHGKVGAEELTATIDSCFVTLLDLAVANGGRLLKFGGDALLLHFSGPSHEARACRAAIDMRRALRVVGRLTVLGQRVSLRMSVGIHSGLFHFFLVGESHRELVVTGPAASTTVTMEAAAGAGEIVISASTAQALRPGVVGPPKGPGFLLRRAPQIPGDPFVPFEAVRPDVDLSVAIPVGLRETIASAHRDSEHRRVTLAFLHFDGTNRLIEEEGPEETAVRLGALLAGVQRAADRHQVAFLATDVDHDGGKIILTAGAPSTTGDDDHRMLLAVRDMMDAGSPLPIRIGVNRGSVFVGEVGPPYRRTFTVMGDAVNLAARLMAKAQPNQIITSPEVISRSRTGFATVELEPFLVKGKAKPVRALSLGDKTGARLVGLSDEAPFVGRRHEVRALEQAVEDTRGGHGQLIEIVGVAGVGKSRLAEQVRLMADGMTQLSAVCEPYDSSTPYCIVRRLLRRLLDLPPERSDEPTAAQFLAVLGERAPSVLPWSPLVAAAIDLSVPETPETGELEEEFRRPRLAEAVTELLGQILPETGILTVEDAHFMDEASADLFRHLTADLGATSWLWCVTRRDEDTGFVAAHDDAARDNAVRVDLEPLDGADAAELAHAITQNVPVPPHELELLVERSGGNPLFLRELIAATTSGHAVNELPDSIEGVIAARIDRLPAEDRHLLRRLSVLGQSFAPELLVDVIDDLPDEFDSTWTRLDEFVSRDAEGDLSFRNRLLRDCAYDGLSYRRRRELHTRAADSILRAATNRREDQPELLSFHYLHAQRYAEAWSYSLQAAERATAVYANYEAAEFFERALTAGRRLPHLDGSDLSGIHEALGDAKNRTGAFTEAAAAYRAARRLVGTNPTGEARLLLKLAQVQGWLDRYAHALRWITRGLRILEHVDGNAATRQRAELLSWYGRFCQEAGRHRRAIKWCTLAVDQAEAVGETVALADALKTIDWARSELGQLEKPVGSERALAIYEDLGDLTGQANTFNALGIYAYFRGEWGEAHDLYQRGHAINLRTGDAVNAAFQVLNIGEIALDQGRLEEAEQAFDTASRTWRAAGYRSGTAYVKCNLARLATGQGRYDDALSLFRESVAESRDIGSHAEALEAQARMAECLLLSGDHAGALSVADEGLKQARALGGIPAQIPLIQRVRGVALAKSGEAIDAMDALEQSLLAAQTRGAEYEVALTLRVLADCDTESCAEHRAEMLEAASVTLSKLGVVWTPDLMAPLSTRPAETAAGADSARPNR